MAVNDGLDGVETVSRGKWCTWGWAYYEALCKGHGRSAPAAALHQVPTKALAPTLLPLASPSPHTIITPWGQVKQHSSSAGSCTALF